jgi:hypothetical protein
MVPGPTDELRSPSVADAPSRHPEPTNARRRSGGPTPAGDETARQHMVRPALGSRTA